MSKLRYKIVKRAEFHKVHQLKALGLGATAITKATGRSHATISRILSCPNWEGYETFKKGLAESHRKAQSSTPINNKSMRPVVDEQLFKRIKELQGLNLTAKQTSEVVGRPKSTIAYLYRFDSLRDYRDYQKGYYKQRQTGSISDTSPPPAKRGVELYNGQALQILQNLTSALNAQTQAFEAMHSKLDEVLETKRPWVSRLKN